MGCNCNNNRCERPSQTACHKCNPAPCQEPQDCSCPTILKTDCSTYSGEDLECSGIKKGTILTELIQQLDAFICKVREDLINAFTLRNIGTGAEVYKGVDLLGRKEIRKINATGDLVSVTQNTDDISIGIDEDALGDFVQDNQKTYSIDNVGTGAEAFKDTTVVGNNTQFNFRSVVKEDLGNGESFLRDIQQNTNELNIRVKTLVSDNLTITSTDDEVRIETPMTASIPALYVNNLYVPSYPEWLAENKIQNGGTAVIGFVFRGKGTLSAPFCDDIVYPLAGGSATTTSDTAIQNALDGDSAYTIPYSYVGSTALSYSRLNPQRSGQKIIIQDNTTFYNFPGNFGYSLLNIDIEANVNSTTTGYIVDMDNILHFNSLADRVSINVLNGYALNVSGDGFNNSGTNITTFLEAQSKGISLKGRITSVTNDISKYLINSDITSTGNNNDGALTFYLDGDIYAEKQGLIRMGGVSRVWNYGKIQSSTPNATINPALKAYLFLGGSFRSFQGSRLEFTGVRTDGFVFTPTGGFTPQMVLTSTTISSLNTITNLFNKTTTDYADLVVNNSNSSTSLIITNIFESPNLWSVVFSRNIFESGVIDNTIVDLTVGNLISVSNNIGANIIENLRIFNNRASAISAGVPIYSAYIKTNGNAYPSTSTWVRDIVLPA